MSNIFENDIWTPYGLGLSDQFHSLVKEWFAQQVNAGCSIRELSHICCSAIQEIEIFHILEKQAERNSKL